MGSYLSILALQWPPKPTWGVDQMPDLTGKVIIVTGGNAGCGRETVKALLSHGAKVYLAARSEEKARDAIAALKKETGKEAIFLPLDLADLVSVRKSAEEFLNKESRLHILFNNGGVMVPPVELTTKQGLDLQWGVNVVGHFFFTKILLPTLIATATSTEKTRVINTSSSGHYLARELDFDLFVDGPKRKKDPQVLYSQSKFGNVVFSRELARRYASENIISHSLHPGKSSYHSVSEFKSELTDNSIAGSIRSDLQRHFSPLVKRIVNHLLYPTPYGALTQLWAGTSPEAGQMNGEFMIPWARLGKPRKETLDAETGLKLWEWLEKQCEGY